MSSLREKFIVDEKGEKVGVFLDMEEYRRVLAALEELEAIRAYDEAKEAGDAAVPFEQAVEEIEKRRR
jgi:sporulation protein YlmC with PRC-barrel domain